MSWVVGSIRLYWEAHGCGPATPLLLLAGMGLDCDSWSRQIPNLATGRRVVAFDHRGSGRSDHPKGAYTTREMAADALRVLDECNVAAAHVLGISLGAMVAQELALAAPARVRSLILVSGSAASAGGVMVPSPEAVEALFGGSDLPTIASFLEPLIVGDEFAASHRALLDELAAKTLRNGWTFDGFCGQVAAVAQHDARSRLGALLVPTLVLAGERDFLLPPGQAEELAASIPGARLVTMSGAGHALNLEREEEFNEEVERWCQQHDGTQA